MFHLQDVVIFVPAVIAIAVCGSLQPIHGGAQNASAVEDTTDNHIAWETWPAVITMLLAMLITVRIVAGSGLLLMSDVLANADIAGLSVNAKANLREGWKNTSIVCALILGASLSLMEWPVESDMANALYLCSAMNTLGLSLMGVLQPSFALMYTDHLSVAATMNFVLCYPWTIGNPMLCMGLACLWLLCTLTIWLVSERGAIVGVYACCIALWVLWYTAGTIKLMSRHRTFHSPAQINQRSIGLRHVNKCIRESLELEAQVLSTKSPAILREDEMAAGVLQSQQL